MKTFWQHENGMVYVVESDSFGRVTGGAGPFRPGELRDLSEYRCGCGVLAWLKQAIVERKLLRINPEIPKDAPPPPTPSLYPRGSRQKTPAAEQTPARAVEPCPQVSQHEIPAAEQTPAPAVEPRPRASRRKIPAAERPAPAVEACPQVSQHEIPAAEQTPAPAVEPRPRASRRKIPAAERPAPAVEPRPRASRRKIPAAQLIPAPPPCQRVVPAKAPQQQEGEPDNLQRERENRRKFAWASAYRL